MAGRGWCTPTSHLTSHLTHSFLEGITQPPTCWDPAAAGLPLHSCSCLLTPPISPGFPSATGQKLRVWGGLSSQLSVHFQPPSSQMLLLLGTLTCSLDFWRLLIFSCSPSTAVPSVEVSLILAESKGGSDCWGQEGGK
jgi:hypothetical protein